MSARRHASAPASRPRDIEAAFAALADDVVSTAR